MSKVIHFELNAQDVSRAVEFYRNAFGWEISEWAGGPEYYLIKAGPGDEPGIDGAIIPAPGKGPMTVVTIGVENIEESLERLRRAGGQTLSSEIQDIPGIGRFAYCLDTEGNQIGLLQPVMR